MLFYFLSEIVFSPKSFRRRNKWNCCSVHVVSPLSFLHYMETLKRRVVGPLYPRQHSVICQFLLGRFCFIGRAIFTSSEGVCYWG